LLGYSKLAVHHAAIRHRGGWLQVPGSMSVGNNPADIESARLKLAKVLLSPQ
jgi:hypothetical protein